MFYFCRFLYFFFSNKKLCFKLNEWRQNFRCCCCLTYMMLQCNIAYAGYCSCRHLYQPNKSHLATRETENAQHTASFVFFSIMLRYTYILLNCIVRNSSAKSKRNLSHGHVMCPLLHKQAYNGRCIFLLVVVVDFDVANRRRISRSSCGSKQHLTNFI